MDEFLTIREWELEGFSVVHGSQPLHVDLRGNEYFGEDQVVESSVTEKAEKKQYYSYDREEFHDDLMIPLEEAEESGVDTIFVADEKEVFHSDFIDIDQIIELMQDIVYEDFGQYWGERYLKNFGSKERKELEQLLNKFFVEKVGKPEFCAFDNIKEVSVKELRSQINS